MGSGLHRRPSRMGRALALGVGALVVLTAMVSVVLANDRDEPAQPSTPAVAARSQSPPSPSPSISSPPQTPSPSPSPTGPVNVYAAEASGVFSPVVAKDPTRVYVPN